MNLVHALGALRPVGLSELEERASLLDRSDDKYVVPQWLLPELLGGLRDTHDVLSVDGSREAGYDSVYFDGPRHELHRAHRQGRRLRWKARTRLYTDSGLCFRGLKVKGPRGSTVKLRERVPEHLHGRADVGLHRFVDAGLRRSYGHGLELDLSAALSVVYTRTTLVSRAGEERLTIDRDLHVARPGAGRGGGLRPDLALLEVKKVGGRSPIDRQLVRRGQRPVQLSKYGVGLVLVEEGLQAGALRPQLRSFVRHREVPRSAPPQVPRLSA